MQTILLVEDDVTFKRIFELAFGKNYAILEASDFYQAFKLFEEHSPDLIISDLNLPEVTGLDLARKIREKNPTVPIIIWSGGITASKEAEVYNAGAQIFLQKPIDFVQLAELLNRLLLPAIEKK